MPAQPPPTPPVPAQPFDLSRLEEADRGMDFHVHAPRCEPGEMGVILVCAARRERNRLEKTPGDDRVHEGLPKATVDLGGGKSLGATVGSAAMGSGATSKRIMVTGTIKF